jgi:hypothetical protein
MPKCPSKACSLPLGTGASARRTQSPQRPCIASHPLCCSGESTPHHPCLHHGPAAVAAPHQVSPGLLGSQVPLARSQKAPPEVCAVVSHAASPAAVACSEVPADQWADDRFSCGLCGEGEPSKI